ncbi:MAG: very short patch repair endonuclease [Sphingobacteriales bacterium]
MHLIKMTDVFSKEKRSEVMGRIKSKNTKPELLVRRFLFGLGFRFRIHSKKLPGRPDIVLKKYNTVILINGCFWHGHEMCKIFKMPQSNTKYWESKIKCNISNDQRNISMLENLGWKVIVIWECQLKRALVLDTLNGLVNKILKGITTT